MKNKKDSNFIVSKKTAIICGDGELPIIVTNELVNKNCNFIILCFDEKNEKYFKQNIKEIKKQIFSISLNNIMHILYLLKNNNVRQVVCCGGVKFPGLRNLNIFNFSNIIFKLKLIKYIMIALFSKQKGDNFLLTLAEKILKTENCEVIAVQTILPNLLCNKKDEINNKLSLKYKKDINYGSLILDKISPYDIGQSIVVCNGRVIGIEGVEGTQNLIKRCGKYYKDWLNNGSAVNKNKPILIKKSKIGQNKKLDIPTIGKKTICDLIENDFAGIVIELNKVFILNRSEILEQCKKHNFFLKII